MKIALAQTNPIVGDVVGKGVPASLLMASVRASLRAYAQDVYDIDEVVAAIEADKPDIVFAPHVETSSGMILP